MFKVDITKWIVAFDSYKINLIDIHTQQLACLTIAFPPTILCITHPLKLCILPINTKQSILYQTITNLVSLTDINKQ